MSDQQAKITDFFHRTKRRPSAIGESLPKGASGSVPRKRKAADEEQVKLTTSSCYVSTSASYSTTNKRFLSIQSRSRIMVELARQQLKESQSPKKETTATISSFVTEHVKSEKELQDLSDPPNKDKFVTPVKSELKIPKVETTKPSCVRKLKGEFDKVADDSKIDEPSTSREPDVTESPGKIILSPLKFNQAGPIYFETSPLKTPKKVGGIISPHKSPPPTPTKPPAFRRLKFLSDRDAETSLFLPSKYRLLADAFISMDKVISYISRQRQVTTFSRIREGVQQMTKRSFDRSKLLQLKTIYPDAFKLTYESAIGQGRVDGTSGIQLTFVVVATTLSNPNDPNSPLIPFDLTPARCVARKNELIRRLTDIVKKHHESFLLSLRPPIRVNPDRLTRWHPEFPLEDVPDLVADERYLPENPCKGPKSLNSVQDVLSRIAQLQQMQKSDGQEVIQSPETPKQDSNNITSTPSSSKKMTTGALKGLSIDFIEKIRQREATRIATELTRSAETDRKISILSDMPSFVRTLQSYFIGEGRSTMSLESVVKKLTDSVASSFGPSEIEERLELLSKSVCPDWVMILRIKKGSFVKITNLHKNLNELESRIQSMKEKLESSTSTIKLDEGQTSVS